MSGQLLFGAGKSYTYLDALFPQATIKTTLLTPEFDGSAYQTLYNNEVVVLFAVDKTGQLLITTTDTSLKLQRG